MKKHLPCHAHLYPLVHLNIDQWGPAVEDLIVSSDPSMFLFCEHRVLNFRRIAKKLAKVGFSCCYHDAVSTKVSHGAGLAQEPLGKLPPVVLLAGGAAPPLLQATGPSAPA